MAEPNKKTPDPNRAKMMRVLIPAVGIALVLILVAVIAGMTGGKGRKMSDGSDGSAEDPELKEIKGGVKYRDLKEGEGEECMPGSRVKVHYTGWLTDGTVFDSTKDKNPIDFSLHDVIPGWSVGLPGQKVGGIRKLVMPPEMGYGNRPSGKIPPGSTLIFEVKLVAFTPPKDLSKLSDGSDPGADDKELKDLGDGLKMRDLKEGSGEPVKPGASVTIHYTGWLLNGKVFDSSYRNGEPAKFNLPGLIAGWQKGIPGMKPGGIRKLVIPPELGYGGANKGDIPPNSTLVFEVELLH